MTFDSELLGVGDALQLAVTSLCAWPSVSRIKRGFKWKRS